MSEFLFSYGLFIAKVITALLALVFAVAIIGGSRKKEADAELKVTNLNEKYRALKNTLTHSIMDKKQFKQHAKSLAKQLKKKNKSALQEKPRPKLYVLEFDGDIKATEVKSMRDEITALLSVAEPQDEVLLKLDNSGGIVHEHGLAASQLQRIKDAKLTFTVSVDKVAASGGYMMACVADKIVAAPFAILGSIGVLAQLPNFNRLLDRAGIDFEQHTAGEYKRTVTMFGKNSDKEREKLKLDLHETHLLFRNFVAEHRPKLDIDKVATGEHWYGIQALDLNLVDEIKTSDEFLLDALELYDIYEIKMEIKKGLQDKLLGGLFAGIENAKSGLAARQNQSKYH
ncbi:MAG: protease SohB [Gammaproteobacteria bacterium]|nr:protease SohB [Gammaproteobacteria bacterium]